MWLPVVAAVLSAAIAPEPARFELWGTVWFQGAPAAGVTIEVIGPHTSQTLISGERGDYRIENAPPGRYRLTASLQGFRPQTREIELTGDTNADFSLELAVLVEVLEGVPDLATVYAAADAVARLRLESTKPAEPCDRVVAATHEAAVLDLVKGALPSRIDLRIEGIGSCVDGAELIKGDSGPLPAGREYLAFLRRDGSRYESAGGRTWLLEVERGLVSTGGYEGLPRLMPVAHFYAVLRRLPR